MPEATNTQPDSTPAPKTETPNMVVSGLEQELKKLQNKMSFTKGKITKLENEEGGLHSQIAKLQDSINSTQDKIANDQLKEEELSDEIAKMRDQMVSIKKILAEYESVGTSD
ncbi:MAG: hypothetical protein QF475_01200 [Candidatus Undinarchaeales archaeon]|jgi:chromosome segregation ATPase|nr:hypothetical protein [Candidatus Undinarchaeales archaeon]